MQDSSDDSHALLRNSSADCLFDTDVSWTPIPFELDDLDDLVRTEASPPEIPSFWPPPPSPPAMCLDASFSSHSASPSTNNSKPGLVPQAEQPTHSPRGTGAAGPNPGEKFDHGGLLLENNSVVWLRLDELKKKGTDGELHAYVFGYDHSMTTPDQKRSRIKCKCWVNGRELKDKLILIGKETAKKPPFFTLCKDGEVEGGKCPYRVQLCDPRGTLQWQGVVRSREGENNDDIAQKGTVPDKMVDVTIMPRQQKKLKGRKASELLADLEQNVEEASEMSKLLPLLRKIVDGLDGLGVGDTAYWHPAGENHRQLEPRDIVGLVDHDCISLDVSRASFVSVVAYEEWVASERNPRRVCHEKAALMVYMGRTQVKVLPFERTAFDLGTPLYIVPDGKNNGVGRVVPAEEVQENQPIVGLFGGYYLAPNNAEIPYAVVDVIIFPSPDRPVLANLLRDIRKELALQAQRLHAVEGTMALQGNVIGQLESRSVDCVTKIDALTASHAQVSVVVMKTGADLTEARYEMAEMKGALDRVVEVQEEHHKDRAMVEKRILALEREMAKCQQPSAGLEIDERLIITGLQRIYLALKIENALNELSMELSEDIYIEPRLYLRDGKKLSGKSDALWSQTPARDGPVLLLGDKGIGKSTFARHECAQWAKDSATGAFGGYEFVFYIDLSVVFTEARLEFWRGQSMISLEFVLHLYLQLMRNRMDCFNDLPSETLLRKVRTTSRCCYIFDGFDYVESYAAPAVKEFLDELRLGKLRRLDYLLLCSTLLAKDKFLPRAEITVSGFEENDVPKFISAVAKSAPLWNLDVKALARLIRTNEQLTEFSRTPLFLLLCCVASKDILRRDNSKSVVVADIFNLALGRLLDGATDRKVCAELLSTLSLKWWNGEDLSIDVKSLHSSGLAQTGIVCATDWRQCREAGGAVQQQLRWSHGCVATYYFALHMMNLLESNYEDAKKYLTDRFDFFVWRVLFGMSRGKSAVRGRLVKLWIEHHTHLTDRMFERGLFRLPEFEGIEILLLDRCEGGSIATRRALTQWLMMKGKWKQALHVANVPEVRSAEKWTLEMACDASCIGEIYLKLEDSRSALKYLQPCWNWWDPLPEEQKAGHWRDFAMVALKVGQCLRAIGDRNYSNSRPFFNASYNICREYLQEFDMRDRIMIFEAMDRITPIAGLKELIMKMHAAHGKQTHSWANRLVEDGQGHVERGEMEQARDCFRRAIELDDLTLDVNDVERAAPWNGLGSTYVTKPLASIEEKAEARRCFETAAEIWAQSEQRGSPTHARILYNLAFVVEPRRGSELLREAIRYDPNCKEFKMALQMLLPSK